MKYPAVQNYVGGRFVIGGPSFLDVYNPGDGSVISKVPLSSREEVDAAVVAAQAAFPGWSALPIKERVQVFYRYRSLLERDIESLAALVTEENGKVYTEAKAEILKSMELTEFACSLPQITAGEVLEVSRGVECRIERFPLGVVASITPFNFPNMVPNWTIPNAIALGNCLILKPSELVPLSSSRIADLLREAGLPDGVLQVVHGGKDVVEAICDHPGIEAISFVGSTKVAKIVYRRGTADPQAGARPRRRQESPDRHARRRPGDDVVECRRVDDRMRRATLHGGVGDGRRVGHRPHHRPDGRTTRRRSFPARTWGR